ncbi:DsrE family protein [Arcobacter roscoffensis]|uniref:DsrE family protein n=1 Tax=Arcobacter roscoffensis TaxID=2961520 RepID=A0ABY5E0J4_9BACT|nr:DsrE family protein [Arcobacter roscoffensis]UTJ05732.1 DsrE family protein [Arcobacter roscoffensis]
MKIISRLILSIFITLLSLNSLSAKQINDKVALNGIKEAKSVFLIDFTNVRKTAFYLNIIEGTHKGLVDQGVKPKMVLVFIGETVKYLSTKQDEAFEMENEEHLESIQNSIKRLANLGVRMEVCAVATKVFKIDNNTIPKEMDIIADGFISLIGWQTQDYKLVPIF